MDIATYARGMAAYNVWMNEKLFACAAELSDEDRSATSARSFGRFTARSTTSTSATRPGCSVSTASRSR